MSCTELYKSNPNMKSGIYEIALDKDYLNLNTKVIGMRFKVCVTTLLLFNDA